MSGVVALAVWTGAALWLATAVGAALVFVGRAGGRLPRAWLCCAGGAMSAASLFSLFAPTRDLVPPGAIAAAVAAGMVFLLIAEAGLRATLRHAGANAWRAWSVVAALSIHNAPEGLALGWAVSVDPESGAVAPALLLVVLMVQDVPEGLAAALVLRAAGFRPRAAFLVGQATGLVELGTAVAAAALAGRTRIDLSLALAAAAGVILVLTLRHLSPFAAPLQERRGLWLAFSAGFLVVALLQVLFG